MSLRAKLQSLPVVGTLFYDLTPAEVRQFWQYMETQYNFTVIDKSSSSSMQLVAKLLDLLGIVKKDYFLKNFTTTLGRRIYTPFVVGVPQWGWDLWSQVEVCAHECQHIHQYAHDGGVEFSWQYVTNHVKRAQYEAEAYTVDLELQWWRYKRLANPLALAKLLSNYGCTATDVAVVAKRLGLTAVSVRSGAVVQEASLTALDWLNHNVPRLKAP